MKNYDLIDDMTLFNNDLAEYTRSIQGERVKRAKTSDAKRKALNEYWRARNYYDTPRFTYKNINDKKQGAELDSWIAEAYKEQN